MAQLTTAQQLEDAAVLAEPIRRRLYLHVVHQPEDVSRDQAADAVKIDRALAAFHLDRLVQAGLLEVSYRRLTGRTGPGAGRPSKLYRRSAKQIEVSVPERRYELLARLLARAAASTRGSATALARAARELGEAIGVDARAAAGPRPSRDRILAAARAALERLGFQPFTDATGTIRLRNCPFDAVARDHRDVVCRMNVDLVDGVLRGMGAKGVAARLEPTAGQCCVVLRRARS